MDTAWLIQTAAIAMGFLGLCFFAFFGAYYVRNRRIALGRGEQVGTESAERLLGASAERTGSVRGREVSVGATEREEEDE